MRVRFPLPALDIFHEMKTSLIALLYQNLAKPLFFLFDPEFIHDSISSSGKFLGKSELGRNFTRSLFHFSHPSLKQKVAGVTFNNPVGLSAGFDKDANLMQILPNVGFGFMEVGTVTHNPYEGNSKPRLYRLKKSKGLVVYYGLKNLGVEKIVEKLKKSPRNFPIILSVGKTNCAETSTDKAGVNDYKDCLSYADAHNAGDIYDINISCPNTFGGEPFTTAEKLDVLLKKLRTVKTKKPMFIKMPINVPWEEFKKMLDVAVKYRITGVIIGNLNKDHKDKNVFDEIPRHVKGGISGRPTWRLSNELISKTYQEYGDKLIIIGVGGIFSAEDAYEKIKRGATLVQLITGMIFQGPQLIGEINRGIADKLQRDGYKNVSEAVGSYYK